MLKKVLPNVQDDWNKLLAKPGYIKAADNSVLLKSGMKMDIVVGIGDELRVIDAKYYDATEEGTLPGWPDLVKQIYYDHALKFAAPTKTVTNCFVFPASGLRPPEFKSAGMFLGVDSPAPGFPEIGIYYAKTNRVLEAYVQRRKDNLGVV